MPAARQRDAFLETEGDAYFERNRSVHADLVEAASKDPLLHAIDELGLKPQSVVEVGASDGWRLQCLRTRLGPEVCLAGVDPSATAVETGHARYPTVELAIGTAERLPHPDGSADLVLFGFCLYLCDRTDLFRIAAEADRVLAEGGSIGIYDFHADPPYRNVYGHREGLASYKMVASRLFDWNPAYTVRHHEVFPHPGADGEQPAAWTDDDLVAVTVLTKNTAAAWPTKEER